MFRKTDLYFYEEFIHIRKAGLIDVEERENKAPGAACFTLPHSKEVFVYSNFSPSFYAINALIHEVGHAFHFYKQFKNDSSMQERYLREEVAELYSLSLELLVMDKLTIFYKQEDEYKEVQRYNYIVLCLYYCRQLQEMYSSIGSIQIQTIHQKSVIRNTLNYAKGINIHQSILTD